MTAPDTARHFPKQTPTVPAPASGMLAALAPALHHPQPQPRMHRGGSKQELSPKSPAKPTCAINIKVASLSWNNSNGVAQSHVESRLLLLPGPMAQSWWLRAAPASPQTCITAWGHKPLGKPRIGCTASWLLSSFIPELGLNHSAQKSTWKTRQEKGSVCSFLGMQFPAQQTHYKTQLWNVLWEPGARDAASRHSLFSRTPQFYSLRGL